MLPADQAGLAGTPLESLLLCHNVRCNAVRPSTILFWMKLARNGKRVKQNFDIDLQRDNDGGEAAIFTSRLVNLHLCYHC